MEVNPQAVWQPLTPRGVAAFAHGTLRRLLLVQLVVATLVAVAFTWCLADTWFPVINRVIPQLPADAEIRQSNLRWPGDTPVLLAENRFIAISVDVEESAQIRSVAHVQIELSRTRLSVRSLFGYLIFDYPPSWRIALNREELQPRWEAWRPAILVGAFIGVVVGLFGSWFGLASLYTVPVWWWGFYLNRDLNLRASWRLSAAALLPGALLMLVAGSFYDLGIMDLVQLTFVFGVHFVMGWVFSAISPFWVGRASDAPLPTKNPFARRRSP